MKKVLVLGGTGAMGVYVVPELVKRGYEVVVASLDDIPQPKNGNPRYIKADTKNIENLKALLAEKFDGIIDFMIYLTEEFRERYKLLLESTGHYIFLSSYRIYAGSYPITENSPRLLDVSDNKEYLATEDYSLYKARGENILRESGMKNWTIVRPAITYSKRRFQLVTLEAQYVINRTFEGKAVILPEEAADIQGTMTWAGDVAKMFAGVLFNPRAMGESFTFATSEHHSWKEIAEYYSALIGLKFIFTDKKTYTELLRPNDMHTVWQLEYDRLFNRIIDNSKILDVAGLKQENFMKLKDGLALELSNLPRSIRFDDPLGANERMDAYLAAHGIKS